MPNMRTSTRCLRWVIFRGGWCDHSSNDPQIAEALSILRDAHVNHQDIKPANVLIRDVGPDIEVALADLGFVNTGHFQVHGSMFQNQPLGTRHYRSPEQIDFFDICEVDIRNLGKSKGYELRTQDPKFYRTFSEKDDLVVFSKLSEPIQWQIDEIEQQSSDDGPKTTVIRIRHLENVDLHDDVRTQITVNKRQTDRTDLFGLGAIIFDMLTCGESPEQFYNLLRVHDVDNHEGKRIEESLIHRYVHFSTGGGTVPEIDTIFQNMRADSNSDLPHPSLVRIILRCMMSKPSDSYWNSESRWKSVKDDLDILIGELGCHRYSQIRHNHLTSGGNLPIKSLQSLGSPQDRLDEIQKLSYSEAGQCVKRLIWGINYLGKIVEMVRKEIQGGSNFSYLANIAPNNLAEVRDSYVPRLALFEAEENFNAMIESGHPRALVQLFPAGGLRPPFIDGLVCEGEIWAKDRKSGDDTVCLGFEIWGRDSGLLYKDKGIGYQRVLIDISLTDRMNEEIERTDYAQGVLYMKAKDHRLSEILEGGRHRAYFVRKFDRAHYYLAMLGIYIRLLFFVDPTKRQMHTPMSVYFFEHGRPVGKAGFRPLSVLSASKSRFFGKSSSLNDLFSLMAGIYARLLTLELGDESPREIVDDFWGRIKEGMGNVLRCDPDHLISRQDDLIKNRNDLQTPEAPDIDRLVREIII